MKNNRKALLLLLCAVLMVTASVFGTLAYLTDTEAVTNTFTVGSVGIQLDEAKVNEDGTYVTDHDNRTEDGENEGNLYHLLPGHTYYKDPTVTVDAKSEDAYVRMMVKVEGLASLKEAMPKAKFPEFYNGDLFLLQNLCVDKDGNLTWDNNVWQYKTFHTSGTYADCYEFRYVGNQKGENDVLLKNGIVVKSDSATVLPDLFTHITVPGAVDNTGIAKLANVKIVVTAHAIQADGFNNNQDAAWSAFDGQVTPTNPNP